MDFLLRQEYLRGEYDHSLQVGMLLLQLLSHHSMLIVLYDMRQLLHDWLKHAFVGQPQKMGGAKGVGHQCLDQKGIALMAQQ